MSDLNSPPPIPPFESEAALWEAALNLLLDLRQYRGLGNQRPDHESAEKLISAFCTKLRECPKWMSLPRLQQEQHLPDHAVVLIAYVVAGHWDLPNIFPNLTQSAIIAFGFEPTALERFRLELTRRKPLGRLLRVEQAFHNTLLYPSRLLLTLIGKENPWESTSEYIQKLPTAPADRDV